MSTSAPRGLASIIITCLNQLEFTRHCVAALKKHTRRPWELIAIDNGSTDHTGVYLAGVRDGANVPVRIISNTTNRGFPAAINQGLKAARGEYLVLLNNDVVVTDGWLELLIGLVNSRRGIEAEGAEPADIGQPLEKPTVGPGAGPRDRRTAPWAPGQGDDSRSDDAGPPFCDGIVPGSAGPTPPGPPFTRGGKSRVGGATGPTPPGPPFTRGGNGLVDVARGQDGDPL